MSSSATGTLTEAEFDRVADDMLERLCEDLEEIEPTAGEDFEIDYAMGVLTMVLDGGNTYVLNKQRPNRQVWLSSPVSGPRRFELGDPSGNALGHWRDVRNGDSLTSVLERELRDMTGVELLLLAD